jgi:hypothetical protein
VALEALREHYQKMRSSLEERSNKRLLAEEEANLVLALANKPIKDNKT